MDFVSQRGMSLVEAIIAIALFTILSLAIFSAITSLYKMNSYTLEQAEEIDHARRGLQTWVRDAREMTFGANGAYPVVRLENNRFGFYSDIDRDFSVEYVEYVLSTTTLYKYTYEATGNPPVYSTTTPTRVDILSLYVRNIAQSQAVFQYYNDAGTILTSPQAMLSDMRYVRMNLVINIDPNRSPGEFMLRGSATPRNLKENL
ncbi:MAG: hypothetical protein RLZZ70_374 [Candidatus Parcubacteria bacterium]|jgi:prepilin-type N-terminal cleavage/methylation domain-containing protein